MYLSTIWVLTTIVCLSTTWPSEPTLEYAWSKLPHATLGSGKPIPTWAKILAPSLPYTTAAMLELEYQYRTQPIFLLADGNPDESRREWNYLSYVARYAVARFHRCAYGLQSAREDLKRCGKEALLESLEKGPDGLSELESKVYRFAWQLADRGSMLTDEQVETLRIEVGNEAMMGLVLQIAHGCFQDRLHWALGISDRSDASSPPLEIQFADSTKNGANTPSAMRTDSAAMLESVASNSDKLESNAAVPAPLVWEDADVAGMQRSLWAQKTRTARIPVPDWDTVVPKIPSDLYRRPLRIRWSRAVVGYQPILGPAWIKCLRVFEQEAHQNRVFEESVFWVVTRSLKCYYCMGHCEMLMEVGGLSQGAIARRTQALESGDWSRFSPEERTAFAFAKKLTEFPTLLNGQDRQSILDLFGEVRALDLIWWTCRCQFMTKVSDAFQLQLESENVFSE